jgi:2-methylisocitrate lyase-like PEP mutase family enzyme
MVQKIQVAADARRHDDTVIVARTDARTTLGIDEALRRGEAFLKAGADILFIESPETEDEMRRIGAAFDAPLLANMVEGGRTPILSRAELESIGYKIAIYPVAGLLAASAALSSVYAHLKAEGTSSGWPGQLTAFSDFVSMIGFERIWDFERRNAET